VFPLQSDLSIDRRPGPLYGHAEQACFDSALDFLVSDLESKTKQAGEFGGLDRKNYSFMDQASLRRHAKELSRFGNVENSIGGSRTNRGGPKTRRPSRLTP